MQENEGYPTFAGYTMRSNNRRHFFLIIIGLIILVVAILAGLYVLGSTKQSLPLQPALIARATTTPLPTSSVSAVLKTDLTGVLTPTLGSLKVDAGTNPDRSKLAVVVLNGSGIAGAAREVSDYLKGMGYKIIKVDNADAFTYSNLTVLVKKSKSNYAGLLKKDLQANPVFASVSASVSDDIESEAEVIVGK